MLFRSDVAAELAPGERQRIDQALDELKAVMTAASRALVEDKTHALNDATQHLAELTMNRTVRAALAGKNVKDV